MPTTEATTLSSASIEQFLESLSAKGRSANTIRAYGSDLKMLFQTHETIPRAEFERTAATWLTFGRADWAPKTTSRRLAAIKAFTRWAGIETPDLDDYKLPTAARPQPHPLPEGIPGVIAMIDTTSSERRRALIALCGLVGLRVGEALAVRPADLNMGTMVLTVRGKGDKRRVVPVDTAAYVYLHRLIVDRYAAGAQHEPLIGYHDRFAREVIAAAGRNARLSRPVSSHDLRATFLTAAFNKTKNLRIVQELAGHASSATTEVYTEVTMDSMRNAAKVV